jgi:hypothetical protein
MVSASAVGLLATAVVPGCAMEDEGMNLLVLFNSVPDDNCEFKPSGGSSAKWLPEGTYDVTTAKGYYLHPEVKNNLETLQATLGLMPEHGYPETNTVSVKGASVWFEHALGDEVDLPDFYAPTSGTIVPNGTTIVPLQILRHSEASIINNAKQFQAPYSGAKILVHVVVDGLLQDGTPVYSNEFVYPITICRGCLVWNTYSSEDCCVKLPKEESGKLDVPCSPGQDQWFDCHICAQYAPTLAYCQANCNL